MGTKTLLVVPEAPARAGTTQSDELRLDRNGIRLGILDNSKSNADHLLQFMVDRLSAAVPISSVVSLRKASVSLPATSQMLDRLAAEADLVVSAMGD